MDGQLDRDNGALANGAAGGRLPARWSTHSLATLGVLLVALGATLATGAPRAVRQRRVRRSPRRQPERRARLGVRRRRDHQRGAARETGPGRGPPAAAVDRAAASCRPMRSGASCASPPARRTPPCCRRAAATCCCRCRTSGVVLRGALANASPALAAASRPGISTAIADLGGSRGQPVHRRHVAAGRTLAWAARAGVLGGLALLIAGSRWRRAARGRCAGRRSTSRSPAWSCSCSIPPGRALVSATPDTPLAQQAAAGLFDAFAGGSAAARARPRRRRAGVLRRRPDAGGARAGCRTPRGGLGRGSLRPPARPPQHLVRGALFLVGGRRV